VFTCHPPLADHAFDLRLPHRRPSGWWYDIIGRQTWSYGPFPSRDRASRDIEARFARWRRRARDRGGWAWRRSRSAWVVTVPVSVPVPGRPLRRDPCTRHGGALPPARGTLAPSEAS